MSRSSRNDPKTTSRKTTVVRSVDGGGDKLADVASRALRGASASGNDALAAKLQGNAATRDVLVRFACERLKAMHHVQGIEQKEMGREREWFKAVAKGQAGYHLPDPTRWHESAKLYQRAIVAMCNGNLGHGTDLLKRAEEAERAAYESLPRMVSQHLDHTNNAPAEGPDEQEHVATFAVAPSTGLPQELRYAQLILNVVDKMEETPPIGRRKGNAWWLEEEEDEDEEDADEG